MKKFCHSLDSKDCVGLDGGSSVGVVSLDVLELALLSESSESIEGVERLSGCSVLSVCVVGSGAVVVPFEHFLAKPGSRGDGGNGSESGDGIGLFGVY